MEVTEQVDKGSVDDSWGMHVINSIQTSSEKPQVKAMHAVKRIGYSLGTEEIKMTKAHRTDASGAEKIRSLTNESHKLKMDGIGQVS